LKACVAKRTRRYDFPERDTHHLYTHAPHKLEKAGISAELEAYLSATPSLLGNHGTMVAGQPLQCA
jgi:hypothetical protein